MPPMAETTTSKEPDRKQVGRECRKVMMVKMSRGRDGDVAIGPVTVLARLPKMYALTPAKSLPQLARGGP